MWFIKESDSKCNNYKNIKLQGLIVDSPIYTSTDHPLFFLLSLVDTMDFFKFFSEHDGEYNLIECLQDIEMTATEDSIEIKFKGNLMDKNYAFLQKLTEQEYWLPINVEYDRNIIIVKFK